MEIESNTSFGSHHSILKTLWKQGQLPTVRRGFYGGFLTQGNVTLEHISLFSRTHRSSLDNVVLATATKNHDRGSRPLWKIIDIDTAKAYLAQFRDVHVTGKFDGNMYIRLITRKLQNIGINIEKGIIEKRRQAHQFVQIHRNRRSRRLNYHC
ncbi:MAG: hypothetical protein K6A44_00130 [bacterium]|nr:hypothetical protein [bacterium]